MATLVGPSAGQTVIEVPPDRAGPAPNNRPVTLDDIIKSGMLKSIQAVGQQVPGIGYPDADRPGDYLVAEGNHRLLACRYAGKLFKMVLLPEPPTPAELRRLRVATNSIRKAMTPDQVAAEITAHIDETGCTQEDAAEFFGFKSSGTVSKLLAPSKRLDPALHWMYADGRLCRDVIRIVATLKSPELQQRLGEQLKELAERNGRVKRETAERLAKVLRGVPVRPPKRQRHAEGGASLEWPGDWPGERLKEWLEARLKTLRRCLDRQQPVVL